MRIVIVTLAVKRADLSASRRTCSSRKPPHTPDSMATIGADAAHYIMSGVRPCNRKSAMTQNRHNGCSDIRRDGRKIVLSPYFSTISTVPPDFPRHIVSADHAVEHRAVCFE